MLDLRQIWGSGKPRKNSNSAETILRHPYRGSPYTNTIVFTAVVELDSSLKTIWFHSNAVQFPRVRHHYKQRHRWVGVKGSTRNGHRDPKCPSSRRLRMVREDTGVPSGGATCAWIAADEAVGCTRAFLTMWWYFRRLDCRGRPESGVQVNDISRIHWSQQFLTTQSEWPN
ncbi:uncharacterized protein TNCV_2073401 [Trichonephila clavipes]|uniref:Uncharacterized protein n=1 Tax=Trichonephila clavipes TaxID=2585209 RepID=A0A8X6RJC0_TRICX|nr:uncharacterized protein TNCV_2073401 [Trichonephila clavipes]